MDKNKHVRSLVNKMIKEEVYDTLCDLTNA